MTSQNVYGVDSAAAVLDRTRATGSAGSGSPARLNMKKLQYRWHVNSDPTVVVNWLEVFTPYDGTAPTVEFKTWANTEGKTESEIYPIDPLLRNDKKSGVYRLTPVEFVDKDRNHVDELKVAKMEDSLDENEMFNFDVDPDRFYVRISGLTGAQNVSIKLATEENPYSTYNEAETEITLENHNGDWETPSLILVSDDVDKEADVRHDLYPDGGSNQQRRTFKVQLGGKVKVASINIDGMETSYDMKVPVPVKARLQAKIYIMSDSGVSKQSVEDDIKIANERFAQLGIKLEVYPIFENVLVPQPNTPSSIVSSELFTGGLTGPFGNQSDAFVHQYGTYGNLSDLEIFYVKSTTKGDGTPLGGFAKLEDAYSYIEGQPTSTPAANTVFIDASSCGSIVLAHELTHVITQLGHYGDNTDMVVDYEPGAPPHKARHNLMNVHAGNNEFGGSRRLYQMQYDLIPSRPYFKPPN